MILSVMVNSVTLPLAVQDRTAIFDCPIVKDCEDSMGGK